MPELPEVETMRRGILSVEGSTIVALRLPRRKDVKPLTVEPSPRRFARHVAGRRIEAVERLGKRLILRLEEDRGVCLRIVFEPRMTGLALLTDPPSTKHLRARFELAGGPAKELLLWDRRGLGTLRLMEPEDFEERVVARLGPDALALTPQDLPERLGERARPIKVALLDQAVVAGVGNIYAAEALFRAKVNPQRACRDLRASEWKLLRKALIEILETAIRYEGSTLGDGTYRNALNEDGSYQNQFRVYAREGETCSRRGCKGQIERIVQAQRATFFCATCQL